MKFISIIKYKGPKCRLLGKTFETEKEIIRLSMKYLSQSTNKEFHVSFKLVKVLILFYNKTTESRQNVWQKSACSNRLEH